MRRLLDGVAMPVPHRSTEPEHPTHWLISTQVSEMQKLIDAKDAKIEELEAALGDPLSLWWKRVTGQEKKNPVQQKPPPPEPPTDLYSA
jgi:hypothetical protein